MREFSNYQSTLSENKDELLGQLPVDEFDYFDVSMQRAWQAALQRWPLLNEIEDEMIKGAWIGSRHKYHSESVRIARRGGHHQSDCFVGGCATQYG